MFHWFKKHLSFEDLNRFADGELRGFWKKRCEKHVQECSECRNQVNDIRKMSGIIAEFGAQKESALDAGSVWSGIEEAIVRRKPVTVSWKDRFGVSFPVYVARPALAMSVIVFLLVSTFFIFQPRTYANNVTVLNRLESENKMVMIFKTKGRKITVIWLMDKPVTGFQTAVPAAG